MAANLNGLTATMNACLDHTREHGGTLTRYPGGFWRVAGIGEPWFGTTTIEALTKRGFLVYTEWAGEAPRKFPVAAVIPPADDAVGQTSENPT